MVLGNRVIGCPTNMVNRWARADCAWSRCAMGIYILFYHGLSYLPFLSLSVWEKVRYRLKYCLKGHYTQTSANQKHDKVFSSPKTQIHVLYRVATYHSPQNSLIFP